MKCKKCGGHMAIDFSAVLTSLPPKYQAKCDDCGNIEYPRCSDCSEEHIEWLNEHKDRWL